jgi:hypothetical protein
MGLDCVVCLKDPTIVAAIELDDKSHEKATRKEADEEKGKALAHVEIAGIRRDRKRRFNETKVILVHGRPSDRVLRHYSGQGRTLIAPGVYGTNPPLIHSNVCPNGLGGTFSYKEMKNER